MSGWRCSCGMPLEQSDIRLTREAGEHYHDEHERSVVLRCQHCGAETPLMMGVVRLDPVWVGGATAWEREFTRSGEPDAVG